MLTTTELKTIITQNFDDIRITSIVLFIDRLLERGFHGGGINQYRIKNLTTDTYITNLTEFLTAIDPNQIDMDYFYFSDKMTGDRTHPIAVILKNFEVEISNLASEDDTYIRMFGSKSKRIMFLMNYLSDGDTVLPLKIIEIRLISV